MLSLLARALRGNRDLSTFLICVALSFISLALPPAAKDGMSEVLSGAVLGPVKQLSVGAAELGRVQDENAVLRRIAVDLMQERADLIEYRHENERLRELLSLLVTFPDPEYSEMLPARVVGMPGGRVVESIEIDVGERDGVASSMPIVVPEGLVGKVARVSAWRSLVEPLTSASSGVSVVTERGRVRGVVKPRFGGSSRIAQWEVDYVQARSDILEGDLVITSGLGGVYPAGLMVGRVSSVREGPLTMSVQVELAVDLSTVEQVFVLTGRSDAPSQIDELKARLVEELSSSVEAEESATGAGGEDPGGDGIASGADPTTVTPTRESTGEDSEDR